MREGGGHIYRAIGVWQQGSGKGPRLEDGAAYCVPDLTPHTYIHTYFKVPWPGRAVSVFFEMFESCSFTSSVGMAILLRVVVTCALANAAAPRPIFEVVVDPVAEAAGACNTLHCARQKVRSLLAAHPNADVAVLLEPGVHHVGDGPLRLGPADGSTAGGSVTWRSADPSKPAVFGGPIPVVGWKVHPTKAGGFVAPLPANISKGTPSAPPHPRPHLHPPPHPRPMEAMPLCVCDN